MYVKKTLCILALIFCTLVALAQIRSGDQADSYYNRALENPSDQDATYYINQALSIYKDILEKNPATDIPNHYFLNAADCYIKLGDNDSATKTLDAYLKRIAGFYGANSSEYANALLIVACSCLEAKDNVQARRLVRLSDSIVRSVGAGPMEGRDTLSWRATQYLKCVLDHRQSKHFAAYKRAEQLVRIDRLVFSKDKSFGYFFVQDLALTSELASSTLRYSKAATYAKEAFYISRDIILDAFNEMSEASRDRYWRKESPTVNLAINHSYSSPGSAYDLLLLSKGILLKTSRDFGRTVRARGDIKAREMLDQMNQATIKGAPVDSLEAMDRRLVQHMSDLGVVFSSSGHTIGWQDIQEALSDDDLAIEFFLRKNVFATNEYVALLIKKGWREPMEVSFGYLVKPAKGKPYIATSGSFVNNRWPNNILRYFPVTSEGRVFFSPAGELNQMGIEYLLAWNGTPIADCFSMYRLSSTREIVEPATEKNDSISGLFGGVRYDLRPVQRKRMLDSLDRGVMRNWDSSVLSLPPPDDSYRGAKPLPGSYREVSAIDSILLYSGMRVDVQTGIYSSEEYFKKLSGSEGMLHIASHGFYIKASDLDQYPYYVNYFGSDAPSQDPQLRTGFYLAGADQALQGTRGQYEDGILTAKEISLMDLSGVELVVLSACDTGLGEQGTDGIYGLQRAFKKAGVHSIVMTLREVNDASTAWLMKFFYENRYILKLSVHDAFYTAVRQLRTWESDNGFPEDWDAFILLDGYQRSF